jgi:hypothetical protein
MSARPGQAQLSQHRLRPGPVPVLRTLRGLTRALFAGRETESGATRGWMIAESAKKIQRVPERTGDFQRDPLVWKARPSRSLPAVARARSAHGSVAKKIAAGNRPVRPARRRRRRGMRRGRALAATPPRPIHNARRKERSKFCVLLRPRARPRQPREPAGGGPVRAGLVGPRPGRVPAQHQQPVQAPCIPRMRTPTAPTAAFHREARARQGLGKAYATLHRGGPCAASSTRRSSSSCLRRHSAGGRISPFARGSTFPRRVFGLSSCTRCPMRYVLLSEGCSHAARDGVGAVATGGTPVS